MAGGKPSGPVGGWDMFFLQVSRSSAGRRDGPDAATGSSGAEDPDGSGTAGGPSVARTAGKALGGVSGRESRGWRERPGPRVSRS
ncbi:hypothetical protein GCM10009848_26160 [Micromonospora lupini]